MPLVSVTAVGTNCNSSIWFSSSRSSSSTRSTRMNTSSPSSSSRRRRRSRRGKTKISAVGRAPGQVVLGACASVIVPCVFFVQYEG